MNDTTANIVDGSIATKPDLDWSQIRETVRLLNLVVAHIEESMRSGDESVNALSDSFTTMAGSVQLIEKSIRDLSDPTSNDITDFIEDKCKSLHAKVQQAIIAFQFYDRLIQRLTHVSQSLAALGELIADQERLFKPLEWTGLQEKIRSRYTMESERLMFDAFMSGSDISEAIKICRDHEKNAGKSHGDIDLF